MKFIVRLLASLMSSPTSIMELLLARVDVSLTRLGFQEQREMPRSDEAQGISQGP
jgi:hypothetical protein